MLEVGVADREVDDEYGPRPEGAAQQQAPPPPPLPAAPSPHADQQDRQPRSDQRAAESRTVVGDERQEMGVGGTQIIGVRTQEIEVGRDETRRQSDGGGARAARA